MGDRRRRQEVLEEEGISAAVAVRDRPRGGAAALAPEGGTSRDRDGGRRGAMGQRRLLLCWRRSLPSPSAATPLSVMNAATARAARHLA